MDVSVVVPVFRNADTVRALRDRLAAVLDPDGAPWEILYVDDACPAGSLGELRRLAAEDARVGVVVLERNVGQNLAVLAGAARARGARIVVMDADLQDPPEAVPALLEALRPPRHAVFAGRRGRYSGRRRSVSSWTFKRLLHVLSRGRLPADAGLFLAMTREMAERVLALAPVEPYVPALVARSGLACASIPVERAARADGTSAYTGAMRWRTAVRGVRTILGLGRAADVRAIPVREVLGAPFAAARPAATTPAAPPRRPGLPHAVGKDMR